MLLNATEGTVIAKLLSAANAVLNVAATPLKYTACTVIKFEPCITIFCPGPTLVNVESFGAGFMALILVITGAAPLLLSFLHEVNILAVMAKKQYN